MDYYANASADDGANNDFWDTPCNISIGRSSGGGPTLLPYTAAAFLLLYEICWPCRSDARRRHDTSAVTWISVSQSVSLSASSSSCAGYTNLRFKAAAVAGPTMPSTFKPRVRR